jgi:hypothetical protein
MAGCGEKLPSGNILDIAFTADGKTWVANGFSLASYDGSDWTVYDSLVHSIVVASGRAAGEEIVWAGGWDGKEGSAYVGRLEGSAWQQFTIASSYPGSFVASAVTPEGQLCGLNPGQGLACFDGGDWSSAGAWTTYDEVLGLDLGQVMGPPVTAPDGTLWALTPGGVVRWDAGAKADDAWTLYGLGAGGTALKPGPLAFGPEGEVWVGATRLQP